MCGICFVLLSSGDSIANRVLDEPSLKRRGPDCQHHDVIQVSKSVQLLMYGCILHFRGPLTPQPLKDDHGNQLLWNGEIFGGFEVGDECDTSVLLRELAKCTDDAEILQTVAKIKGPVAFAYWQATDRKLWFGRDVFGRRSLLWHLPVDEMDNFIVTSVQTAEQEFQEIPAAGIYCIDLQQLESKTITLFPWENYLSIDTLLSDMQQKLSLSVYSIGIQEYSIPVHISSLNKTIPDMNYAIPSVGSMSPLEYLDFIGKRHPEYLDYSNQLLNLLQEAINLRVFNQPRIKVNSDEFECDVYAPINNEKDGVLDQLTVTEDIGIFKESIDGQHLISQMTCNNCGMSLGTTDKPEAPENKSVNGHNDDFEVPQTNVQTTQESVTNCDMDENVESDEGTKFQKYEPTNVECEQQKTSELYLCSLCKMCRSNETVEARQESHANNPSPINSDSESVCHNKSETEFANQIQGICENKYTGIILEDPYRSNVAFADIDIIAESQPDKETNPNFHQGTEIKDLVQSKIEHKGTEKCSVNTELPARVAILFSGGIDSTVIAALADRCVPEDESIDLINVAFEQQKRETSVKEGKKRNIPRPYAPEMDAFSVPDRLTGHVALQELNPRRKWNFVEVNVTVSELQKFRHDRVQKLIYPLNTVLDDSIGCAVWFAVRGRGILGNGRRKGDSYASEAKVILVGMGADEQLAGYARHRVQFKEHGWLGLVNEIEMEVARISTRNLGRDDRIIADHSKEARFPFLDENVVNYLSQLPIQYKADLTLPRGLGEKLILRLCAIQLNLSATATLPKRAIQFGSRIAKCENKKEKASDVCGRLTSDAASCR